MLTVLPQGRGLSMQISVIITTYNYGHFLPDCLESVLSQTVPPDEIVIVDDGSTDNTSEVIQPYLSNPRVTYIKTVNSGVSAARNTAIAATSGDIIAILDADDKWRSDKLELQLPLFEMLAGSGMGDARNSLFSA